ncbi:hypothetical protein [Paraburkholderia sp. GAS41]|jgi:hypothetical protein|uniref:hypothetical protein n=1 Tax=Paraburkholderia sp. GAS41 TaxID=3035134 RepID=UPI003D1D0AD1
MSSLRIRGTHSKKEGEDALAYAEASGWRIRSGGKGHAWGKMYCPYNDSECRCGEFCITSVLSTPRNPGNHARLLKGVVDNCTTHRQKRAPQGANPQAETQE